jgi:hypothetical protein
VGYSSATEVILLLKLGENEVLIQRKLVETTRPVLPLSPWGQCFHPFSRVVQRTLQTCAIEEQVVMRSPYKQVQEENFRFLPAQYNMN